MKCEGCRNEAEEGRHVCQSCLDYLLAPCPAEAALAEPASAEGLDEEVRYLAKGEGGATVTENKYLNSPEQGAGATPSGPKETSVEHRYTWQSGDSRRVTEGLDDGEVRWQAETLHEMLDKLKVPRGDGEENFSLWGRVDAALKASDLRAELESLRELSEKATAGKWRIEKRGETVVTLCAPVAHEQDDPRIAYFYGAFADKADKQTPNAEFAVACVNAVRVIIEGKD